MHKSVLLGINGGGCPRIVQNGAESFVLVSRSSLTGSASSVNMLNYALFSIMHMRNKKNRESGRNQDSDVIEIAMCCENNQSNTNLRDSRHQVHRPPFVP